MKRKCETIITNNHKKIRTDIEDLSNELLYEIFEYFDGFYLYNTFSQLNKRFQDLIFSSKFRLNFQLPSSIVDKQYQQFLIENKHRIQSFSIFNIWINQTIHPILNLLDQSFNRLESIHISTTSISNQELKSIYKIIFNLPLIKTSKISLESDVINNDYQLNDNHYPTTSIQYLNMDHSIDLHGLKMICSATRQICRLDCTNLNNSIRNDQIAFSNINLSQLTHLSIDNCEISFENFKNFIQILSSPLKYLRLSTCFDINYLNANQWEQLINQYLPNLQIFNFIYEEFYDDQFQLNENHTRAHKFTSSFWTKRKWFFEVSLSIIDWSATKIIFAIRPYKQQQHPTEKLPISLTIDDPCYLDWNANAFGAFQLVSAYIPITYLNLDYLDICAEHLIRLIRLLSHLDSMKIFSFCTPTQPSENFDSIAQGNHITKVHIERINRLEQVQFIFGLCLYLQYLEIECTSQIDILSLLRTISICIINRTLSTLCVKSKQINEHIIEQLRQNIDNERLFQKYEIEFRNEKIFINFL